MKNVNENVKKLIELENKNIKSSIDKTSLLLDVLKKFNNKQINKKIENELRKQEQFKNINIRINKCYDGQKTLEIMQYFTDNNIKIVNESGYNSNLYIENREYYYLYSIDFDKIVNNQNKLDFNKIQKYITDIKKDNESKLENRMMQFEKIEEIEKEFCNKIDELNSFVSSIDTRIRKYLNIKSFY